MLILFWDPVIVLFFDMRIIKMNPSFKEYLFVLCLDILSVDFVSCSVH